MSRSRAAGPPLCPSAPLAVKGARLFGVQVQTAPEAPRQLAYLDKTHPITEQVLALSRGAPPDDVLRVAADCIEGACLHWHGSGCRLATRVATMLPQAVSAMPRCAIRPTCLWFKQEGPAACLRCPQVATVAAHAADSLEADVARLELEPDNAAHHGPPSG